MLQRVGGRRRTLLVVALVLVVVAGLALAGVLGWERLHRTHLEAALGSVPAGSLRVGFTDWGVVRREVGVRADATPTDTAVEKLVRRAYDLDFSAASSIDDSAVALQEKYGFGPANAQWEAFAQGRKGAAMVLKMDDGTDFDALASRLRSLGYDKPKVGTGVWRGGVDLVAGIDVTISPELQQVVLLADQGLVVSSDSSSYAATAAKAAAGDAATLTSKAGITDVAGRLDSPANAMVWSGDFACEDLAMSSADADAQAQAARLVKRAGGVTPLAGLAMAMRPDRTLRVVEHFEDSDQARDDLRPRARLAVGEAVGRGGSFADDFRLTTSKAVGSDVVLDLRPREKTGYVLSALYDGPLVLATC